jgi:hypothetical protein
VHGTLSVVAAMLASVSRVKNWKSKLTIVQKLENKGNRNSGETMGHSGKATKSVVNGASSFEGKSLCSLHDLAARARLKRRISSKSVGGI